MIFLVTLQQIILKEKMIFIERVSKKYYPAIIQSLTGKCWKRRVAWKI